MKIKTILTCVVISMLIAGCSKEVYKGNIYNSPIQFVEDNHLDGAITILATESGPSQSQSIFEAQSSAVESVLFKGIAASKHYTKPIVTEVNAYEKYKSYFNEFFRKEFKQYTHIVEKVQIVKSNSGFTATVKVRVDVDAIEKRLKKDKIIKY